VSATPRIWREGVTLEFMRSIQPDTLTEHLGIVFTELGPDYLRATMPVTSAPASRCASCTVARRSRSPRRSRAPRRT
jgi:hypothetical protein